MKELELFSTRLTKDLKDRVSDFTKAKGVTIQKFTEYAFKKVLSENKNIKSQATLFMEEKLEECSRRTSVKANELLENLIDILEEKKINLGEEIDCMIFAYEEARKEEITAFGFYQDTL